MRSTRPIAAVLVQTLILSACSFAASTEPSDASASVTTGSTEGVTNSVETTSGTAGEQEFTIALALIGEFGPVREFIDGFKEALSDAGLAEDEGVIYVEHNAQNDQALVPLMARQVVNESPDLILAIGTPVVISLAQETETVPILFGAIADPIASGLIDDVETPGTNLTGSSVLLDPGLVLDLVVETLPDAGTLGIIANPGHANSAAQLEAFEAAAPSFGVEIVTAPIASTSDAVPAATSLEGRVDAVILGQDNTAAQAYEVIADALIRAGLPIFVANADRAEQGLALVGVGPDYATLGFWTGDQAVQILLEDADPAVMPVVFPDTPGVGGVRVAINLGVAEVLGVEVPDSVLEDVDIYEETPYAN